MEFQFRYIRFRTPLGVSWWVCGAHLRLDTSWVTRLLSQWMLHCMVASQWQHRASTVSCTHPLRRARGWIRHFTSRPYRFWSLRMADWGLGFVSCCKVVIYPSFYSMWALLSLLSMCTLRYKQGKYSIKNVLKNLLEKLTLKFFSNLLSFGNLEMSGPLIRNIASDP